MRMCSTHHKSGWSRRARVPSRCTRRLNRRALSLAYSNSFSVPLTPASQQISYSTTQHNTALLSILRYYCTVRVQHSVGRPHGMALRVRPPHWLVARRTQIIQLQVILCTSPSAIDFSYSSIKRNFTKISKMAGKC